MCLSTLVWFGFAVCPTVLRAADLGVSSSTGCNLHARQSLEPRGQLCPLLAFKSAHRTAARSQLHAARRRRTSFVNCTARRCTPPARATMWRAALRLRHAAPCATLAAVTAKCDDQLQKRTTWKASSDKLGPPRVHRIVITGGPCAGKTTAMAKLSLRLQNMGFDVFVVPEVRDAA